jgi:ribosomal protein L31
MQFVDTAGRIDKFNKKFAKFDKYMVKDQEESAAE